MPVRARPEVPPGGERYRPLSRRRRLLLGALGVATAVTLILIMLDRTGAPELPRRTAPAAAASGVGNCAPGQLDGCVGGRVAVIVVPPAAPASAPR